ncbi:MAG: chromate transporter [Clostridia bacterium]|nr:chromate transporter [Clostridia bacterium]
MNILQLLLAFLQVGAFSIGGGYAAMPLIREQTVVLHPWLTAAEFADLVTIAEMTPGPIALNAATFVGMRVAGLPGALAATLGCVLPSIAIVSLLSWLYARCRTGKTMQTILGTLRPVVVALIASAAVTLIQTACTLSGGGFSLAGCLLMLGAFGLLQVRVKEKKFSPILVMALCGAAGVALHAMGWM